MTRSILEVRQYLQCLTPFMHPPGYIPLDGYGQTDEKAVALSAADQQVQKRSFLIRALSFILSIPIVILVLAVLIMTFSIGGILFGVALAMIRFLQILPVLAIAAFASGTTCTSAGYVFPTWRYAYQVVVQFFQAGLAGAGAVIAVLGIILAFATAIDSARTASRRTPEASASQEAAQDFEDGDGMARKSRFQACYTMIIKKLAAHFLFTPSLYLGVHVLRLYYGSGWELIVPLGEFARPVVLATIGEGAVKLVTAVQKYLRDRRRARRGVPDEGPGADESLRLDVLKVDASKP